MGRPGTKLVLVAGLAFAFACRTEFSSNDEGSDSTTTTEETNGTTGDPDPLVVCEECQSERCANYLADCKADPDCTVCLGAPYSLSCLSLESFRKVADCSCNDCATECPHLCPGGQGSCDACGLTECAAEGNACIMESSCAPCLEDHWAPGCDTDPTYMAANACQCEHCGQECVWACPEAANACAACLSSSCQAEFGACVQDAECTDCFENPLAPGCDQNANLMALQTCTCASCESLCGVLFNCP